MNNAPADPLSWYYDIPVVTRVYLTGAFMTTVSNLSRSQNIFISPRRSFVQTFYEYLLLYVCLSLFCELTPSKGILVANCLLGVGPQMLISVLYINTVLLPPVLLSGTYRRATQISPISLRNCCIVCYALVGCCNDSFINETPCCM